MAHMLRKRNSRGANIERKGEMVVGVGEHVFDHIQKLEDQFYLEGQTDRFAKKGRSCLGIAFSTLAPDGYEGPTTGEGSILVVNIRLFCNDSKQDFEQSISLMNVGLALFKEICPWVTKLNGSKDGASNFQDSFQFAYPRLLEIHGLQGGIIDTPETAAGKDEADQD